MKIGFLAMSGLRAHDSRLLELGLTLPGLKERGKVLSSLPSLGLLYLAACTPPGHELHYFEAEGDGSEPAAWVKVNGVRMWACLPGGLRA